MAFKGDPTSWTRTHVVHVRKDAGLAELLRTAGPYTVQQGFAQAADPTSGAQPTVNVPGRHAGVVAEELAGLLRQARAAGHPAAGHLAHLAGHLGVADVAPQPEAAQPAPAPAPTLTAQ